MTTPDNTTSTLSSSTPSNPPSTTPTSSTPPNPHTLRFSDLLPLDIISNSTCTVIGTGAVGHQVARQLASLGIHRLFLIDPDTVDDINVGPQMFSPNFIGTDKVDAIAAECRDLCPSIALVPRCRNWTSTFSTGTIFCCVDSIDTRRFIYESLCRSRFSDRLTPAQLHPFIDTRMLAEACRIITINSTRAYRKYADTLFPPEEAVEAPCTSRTTNYCACLTASLAVNQWTKHLRSLPLIPDFTFNLLTSTIYSESPTT